MALEDPFRLFRLRFAFEPKSAEKLAQEAAEARAEANENKLFYSALYWTEALPGGGAFIGKIAKKYNKPYMPTGAPKQDKTRVSDRVLQYGRKQAVIAKLESGVTQEECEVFFDTLYGLLKEDKEKTHYPGVLGNGTYIELAGTGGRDDITHDHFIFSDSIEAALKAAGLDRAVLPLTRLCIHDNGQVFAIQDRKWAELKYPGRLDTGYKPVRLSFEDFEQAPEFIFEHFYRLVPLEPGKSYKSSDMATNGKKYPNDFTAGEGDVLILSRYEMDGFETLTDEEILSGTSDKVWGGLHWGKEQYTPGYVDPMYGYAIEATDDPRIVRYLSKPMHCIDVTEHIQIGAGSSFELAKPGDKISCQGKGYSPRVIRRSDIDSGQVRLIPVEKPPKVSSSPQAPKL